MNHNRRFHDGVITKDPTHKLNADRRIPGSERRVYDDPSYRGPPRRQCIDRRMNIRDRRCAQTR